MADMDGQHTPTHTPLRPLGALVDLLAPPRCAVCRRRVAPGAGLAWCTACGRDVCPLVSPCGRCGAPGGRDEPCPLDGTAVAATVAAHAWTGTVAAVVRTGKLDGCHAVFPLLGAAVAAAVRRDGAAWPPVDLVCPVPASPRRRRRRGFDHAFLMARAAAHGLGLPCDRVLTLRRDTRDRGASSSRRVDVVRDDEIGSTDRLRDEARLLATVIAIRQPVRGHVMLVDDVVTTGTTVAAAATVLRSAGATRVSVAALARAGHH